MGNISWGRSHICMLLNYLVGLFIMGLTAWLVSQVLPLHEWISNANWFVALLPAIAVCVVAIILCCRAGTRKPGRRLKETTRRVFYYVCYWLNAIASGLAVAVLVIQKGVLLSAELLVSLVPAVALGIVLFLLFLIPSWTWRKIISITFTVLSLVLVIVSLWVWARNSDARGCAAAFSLLFFLLFPRGMYCAANRPRRWLRHLAYTGFGAFAVILFVVILFLSEGEGLDGLEFDLDGLWGDRSQEDDTL